MKTRLFDTKVTPVGDRKMAFTISTAAVDRDGDTIDPKGWALDNFRRSPVVLWSHDHNQPPIGRASKIWNDSFGLYAEIEFTPVGMNPFADMIHDMCKGGFLNCSSVGFRPLEAHPNRSGGQNITKAELLEFSIVSIPANPQALMQRTVNRSAVLKWLGKSDEGLIDWDAINKSAEPESDWQNINLPRTGVEVNATTDEVNRVLAAYMPEIRDGLRKGIKLAARRAAQDAINHLTGRLD